MALDVAFDRRHSDCRIERVVKPCNPHRKRAASTAAAAQARERAQLRICVPRHIQASGADMVGETLDIQSHVAVRARHSLKLGCTFDIGLESVHLPSCADVPREVRGVVTFMCASIDDDAPRAADGVKYLQLDSAATSAVEPEGPDPRSKERIGEKNAATGTTGSCWGRGYER